LSIVLIGIAPNGVHLFAVGEKSWVTKDCYFRLTCSMIEMHVTEAWKLADFHNIINYTTKSNKRPITMHWFEGVLGHQMISNASSCSKHYAAFRVEPEKENLVPPTLVTDSFSLNISLLSDNCVGSPCLLIPVCSLSDCQGAVHHQVKLPIQIAKNGK